MPINYKEYHPDWKAISLRIRKERAQDKCEWCGVPNYSIARTNKATRKRETMPPVETPPSYAEAKDFAALRNEAGVDGPGRWSPVVLTVAHIDRDKTNNDDENLAALCQHCHLNHDRHQHIENARNGREWKRDQLRMDLPNHG